jgi:hypothetical protein
VTEDSYDEVFVEWQPGPADRVVRPGRRSPSRRKAAPAGEPGSRDADLDPTAVLARLEVLSLEGRRLAIRFLDWLLIQEHNADGSGRRKGAQT